MRPDRATDKTAVARVVGARCDWPVESARQWKLKLDLSSYRKPLPQCIGRVCLFYMHSNRAIAPRLLALSDLHVTFPENREIVESLWPESAADWLLVAGDVAERFADVEWALRVLSQRFATVVWAPGNHELWTHPGDEVQLRGEERYAHLVGLCRSLGVLTLEDPYPVWDGAVVYGHLHIPRTTWHDGVRFEEASLGYPREWQARGRNPGRPRRILSALGSRE
jgi:predicted phosphodiesterase